MGSTRNLYQKLLTIDIQCRHMASAIKHIPGFAEVLDHRPHTPAPPRTAAPPFWQVCAAAQEMVLAKTGLRLDPIKSHAIDQHGLPTYLQEVAPDAEPTEEAAFAAHRDTDEEFEASDKTAICTILITVVVRLDNFGTPSGMVVYGFDGVSYESQGAAVAFPAPLWHATSQRGGLKVASFFGKNVPGIKSWERYRV